MHRLTLAKRAALTLICTLLLACSPAPEFHYADGSGGRFDDYRGKYLLINYLGHNLLCHLIVLQLVV